MTITVIKEYIAYPKIYHYPSVNATAALNANKCCKRKFTLNSKISSPNYSYFETVNLLKRQETKAMRRIL